MRPSNRITPWILLFTLAASLPGCGPKRTVFLDTAADFGAVRRVAVLPFENLTGDGTAGEKVQQLFIIELLALEVVEVVDPGEVARVLAEEQIDDVRLVGADEVAALAERLEVQAIVLGSVQEFGMDRGAGVNSPQVSLTCRMLEADGGSALWSVAVSRKGAGAMARLFGVSGDSPTEAARKMVHDALKTLVK